MNSKAVRSDKLFPRRKIMFPRASFVELTLSPKDVQKMRLWEKEGRQVDVVWYANCKRVLFVDTANFKEMKKA